MSHITCTVNPNLERNWLNSWARRSRSQINTTLEITPTGNSPTLHVPKTATISDCPEDEPRQAAAGDGRRWRRIRRGRGRRPPRRARDRHGRAGLHGAADVLDGRPAGHGRQQRRRQQAHDGHPRRWVGSSLYRICEVDLNQVQRNYPLISFSANEVLIFIQVPWDCGGAHRRRAAGRQLRPDESGSVGQVGLWVGAGLGEGADARGQDQGPGEEGQAF